MQKRTETPGRLWRLPSANPPVAREKTLLEAVPDTLLVEWSAKLYTVMNLAWGYVETILDLCAQMKIPDTRPLCRTIRELKREYDRFRSSSMWGGADAEESKRAEDFEDFFSEDFDRLFNGLEMEVNKLDLTPPHKLLVIAVQQTLTLMDAARSYAIWTDSEIRKYGAWADGCSFMQKEFLALYPLIPQFAGDCYSPDLSARKLTADILVGKMHRCMVVRIEGEEDNIKEAEVGYGKDGH